MITQLYLAGNYVAALRGHLQIVGIEGSSQWEVEVQSSPGVWDVRGLDPNLQDHTAGSHYGEFGFYGRAALDLEDRDASDVWGLLQQAGVSFDAAQLEYTNFAIYPQNSNTFAYSMLLSVGIDASEYYGQIQADGGWGLSFPGDWDARDLVTFRISGTTGIDWFYSGAKDDVIIGGDGADILDGGGGSDIIILGNINGNNAPLDETDPAPDPRTEEDVNGGGGKDYLVVTSGHRAIVTIDAADADAKIDTLLVHAKKAGVEGAGDYQLIKLVGGVYASVALLVDGVSASTDYNYTMNRFIDENGNEWQQYKQYTEPYNVETNTLEDALIDYFYCPALHRLEIGISDGEEFFQTIIIENFNEGDLGISFQGVLLSHGVLVEGQNLEEIYPPPDAGFLEGISTYFSGVKPANSTYSLKADGSLEQSQMMMFSSETEAITADDLMMALDGGDGVDQLVGIDLREIINGYDGNDILSGKGGDDTIIGETGDDHLNGGTGADILDGGDGTDIADYQDSTTGVVVNLTSGSGLGGEADGDTLLGIENVRGSAYSDHLSGDASDNLLMSDAGDDFLQGDGGNDALTGGLGSDTFHFAAGFGLDTISDFATGAGASEIISLALGEAFDSYAEIMAATAQVGANAVITIDASNKIELSGVSVVSLAADDFMFA